MKTLMLDTVVRAFHAGCIYTTEGHCTQSLVLMHAVCNHALSHIQTTACVLDGPVLRALLVLLLAGVTTLERPSEQNGSAVTAFRLHSCELV